jgi:hypothetical protein
MNEGLENNKPMAPLASYLEELLGAHECVCIPGLGGFLRREHTAAFNRFTGKLLPEHTTVFFNEALKNDDGLLGNLIANRLQISYNEAAQLIRSEVKQLQETFNDHKQHPFGNLGIFFCNQDGRLFFIPSTSLNLHVAAFGLMEVQLRKVAAEKPQTASVPPIPIKTEEKPTPRPAEVVEAQVLEAEAPATVTRFRVWKVAAALALMTLGGALVLKLSHQFGQSAKQQQAEVVSVRTEPKAELPVPAPVEKTAPVVQEVQAAKQAANLSRFDGAYQINGGLFLSEKTAGFAAKAFADAGYTPKIHKPENSTLYRLIVTTATDEAAARFMIDSLRVQIQAHYSTEPSLLPFTHEAY